MAKSYQDYQKEIAELQKKAEEARRAELTGAIAQIKSLMAQFNLSIKDLKLKDGKVSRAPGKAVAAKYRDPITGEAWSGRGRSPAWVIKAKAENKLDALIISGASSEAAKAPIKADPKKSALKKTVAKPAVKKSAQRKSATKPAEPTAAAATTKE
ncbi:MAG: H-NS histone family protein [Pseudomonadota bacterium]